MESIFKDTNSFWWPVSFQAILCLLTWSIIEIFDGSDKALLSALILVVLVGLASSYKGFKLVKPLVDRVLYVFLGQAMTLFNIMVFGIGLGQILAILLGLWSFPPQD